MAKQTIDIGTTANDGTGTLLRDAFDMVNDNFTELYNDETTGEVNSITATAPINTMTVFMFIYNPSLEASLRDL